MDVGSSSGASSSDVLASGNGAATAGGFFCFGVVGFCGFGFFGLQIYDIKSKYGHENEMYNVGVSQIGRAHV